jgi:hypothetical protein
MDCTFAEKKQIKQLRFLICRGLNELYQSTNCLKQGPKNFSEFLGGEVGLFNEPVRSDPMADPPCWGCRWVDWPACAGSGWSWAKTEPRSKTVTAATNRL